MVRRFQGLLSVGLVVVSLVLLCVGGIRAAADPIISVDPKVIGAAPDESFSVDVTIADVADLYSWQFNLTFNPSVLQAVIDGVEEGSFMKQFRTTLMATPNIDNTNGWVFAGVAFLDWEDVGASGSGVLATVTFTAVSAGTSSLHFSSETGLRTYDGENILSMPCVTTDGVFGYPRDLEVTGLVVSPSSVPAGESVSLDATVVNNGVVDEVFNVTFYRNSTVVGMRTDLALDSGASTSVVFSWDTTGVAAGIYVMKAEVNAVSGESDTANNVFEDGTVAIQLVHDVAITGVTVSPSSVQSGGQVTINVTVLNKGSATESFGVQVSYDSTAIGTKQVSGLAPGASETLTFTWETKDVPAGTYELAATTSTISGETSTDDNVYSDVALEITSSPFTLPIEGLAVIAVIVIVVLASGIFLYMRRRSKKS